LDTSAILDGWIRYYPPENFPSLWEKLDDLIAENRIYACRQVLEELATRDDGAHAWLKDRMHIVIEIDLEQFGIAQHINDQFPGWATKKRSGADPFVIALAELNGWKVLTGERFAGTLNPLRVKIPDVCKVRGVECGALIDVAREEKWTF
jgi:hypothetical protein